MVSSTRSPSPPTMASMPTLLAAGGPGGDAERCRGPHQHGRRGRAGRRPARGAGVLPHGAARVRGDLAVRRRVPIFNTFSIIVAQRTRELALFRTLGASRRQVMASVVGEALDRRRSWHRRSASLRGIGIAVAAPGTAARGSVSTCRPRRSSCSPGPIIAGVRRRHGGHAGRVDHPRAACGAGRADPGDARARRDRAAGAPRPADRDRRRSRRVAGIAALLTGLFGGTGSGAQLVGLGAALTFVGVATLSPVDRPSGRRRDRPTVPGPERLGQGRSRERDAQPSPDREHRLCADDRSGARGDGGDPGRVAEGLVRRRAVGDPPGRPHPLDDLVRPVLARRRDDGRRPRRGRCGLGLPPERVPHRG